MNNQFKPSYQFYSWVLLWAAITLIFLVFVPGYHGEPLHKFIPMTADMLHSGNWLIPHWHGGLYTNKPPLMNWLFIAGWKLFGIVPWWPQLVSMTCAGIAIYFTQALAKRLWPEHTTTTTLTPFVLIGLFNWIVFSKALHVDFLLILAVTMGLFAYVGTLQQKRGSWLLYGISISLGTFAKGPVVFLFLSLAPLIVTLLATTPKINRHRWFWQYLGVNLVALLPITAWAGLVLMQQGWGTVTVLLLKPIQESHHSPRHWYFYFPQLIGNLVPWILYWPFLRHLRSCIPSRQNLGVLLTTTIVIVALVFFSFYTQRRTIYLWPILPSLALLVSYAITQHRNTPARPEMISQWIFAALAVFLSLLVLFPTLLPLLGLDLQPRYTVMLTQTPGIWAIPLLIISCLGFVLRTKTIIQQVILLSCLVVFANATVVGIVSYYKPGFRESLHTTFQQLQETKPVDH